MKNVFNKDGYLIMKFSDGFWLTFWDSCQRRRIKSRGPYKNKDSSKMDLEILNSKYEKP